MPEAAGVEVEGRVVEELPGALYRVALESGARQEITAHAAGESGLLRMLPGDRVLVRLSSNDGARGRIVRKRQ